MAIEKFSGGGAMERRVGMKVAAKAAKHPAKKHAAKKHAAKHAEKHAAKHAGLKLGEEHFGGERERLGKAFHHLQRASAVISLLEADSGGDLRTLLGHAVRVYRIASSGKANGGAEDAAWGLARGAEHLALAGLYLARKEHATGLPAPGPEEADRRLGKARKRLNKVGKAKGDASRRLLEMLEGLLPQAEAADDAQLKWELSMAADGISTALEAGM